jgi:hypothetical protein
MHQSTWTQIWVVGEYIERKIGDAADRDVCLGGGEVDFLCAVKVVLCGVVNESDNIVRTINDSETSTDGEDEINVQQIVRIQV